MSEKRNAYCVKDVGVDEAANDLCGRKLLGATIEAIAVESPEPTPEEPQHLCLDKGFDSPRAEKATTASGYTPHIRRIGEERSLATARREQAETIGEWRGILMRCEKQDINYLGLLQLACGLTWYRRLHHMGQMNIML